MANLCPGCGGDCQAIFDGLRAALDLEPLCAVCGDRYKQKITKHGETLCLDCAWECFG